MSLTLLDMLEHIELYVNDPRINRSRILKQLNRSKDVVAKEIEEVERVITFTPDGSDLYQIPGLIRIRKVFQGGTEIGEASPTVLSNGVSEATVKEVDVS